MSKQLQLRRGTTAEHSTFTGAVGEATIDTDKDVVVVHDGVTVGGHALAKQSAVDLKATIASPTLTGTPAAPTAAVGTSTTQLATTAFVQAEIANDTYPKLTVDWRDTAMSKAQFNALAAERRANRAGSGFDEFGKHNASSPFVNEGIVVDSGSTVYSNKFMIGRTTSAQSGTSRTDYPVASINGVVHKMYGIDSTAPTSTAYTNWVTLPPAPTVLPYDATLTQQQIDSGVIKHADASNSGLIVNGKFDTDTSGWVSYETNGTIAVVSGRVRCTNVVANAGIAQSFSTVIGKQYTVEGELYKGTTTVNTAIRIGTSLTGNQLGVLVLSLDGRFTLTFTATTTTTYFGARTDSATVGQYVEFDNIAVFPADAISRSDLVFLEQFHEDVSEKDFVYPLGNVQYLGTTGDSGTPVAGAFAGSATYSLFGNWQASGALVGRGYVWSTMTDAQKKAFVSNPENNCYLDGDKVIQVRYRMRVQLGEDTWTMSKATVQGKAVTASTVLFTAPVTTVDAGLYSNTSATYTYTGTTTSAVAIALVHRRNQGGYNVTYNPNGTKLASDGNKWYNTAVSFTSIADCFTDSKLLANSGSITSGVSGRPD